MTDVQVCWLIERGQNQNHTPTVWWAANEEEGWGGWTPDALLAFRYPSKADAESVIDGRFRFSLSVPPTADAVEHAFS